MNKKYTEEERRENLVAWRKSGMSGGQFCRENDIRPTTFYNWTKSERKKQNNVKSGIVKLPNFQIPVPSENKIILEYGNWKIILPPGFNPNDATAVMALMESKQHVS